MSNDEEEQKRAFELIHAMRGSSGETPPLFVNRVVASEHAQRLLHDISVAYTDAMTGAEIKPTVKSFNVNLDGFRVVCDENMNPPESLGVGELKVTLVVPPEVLQAFLSEHAEDRPAMIRLRMRELYFRRLCKVGAKTTQEAEEDYSISPSDAVDQDRPGADPVRGLMRRLALFMPRTSAEEKRLTIAAMRMRCMRALRKQANDKQP